MKNLTTAVFATAFTFLSIAAFAVDTPDFVIKNEEGQKSFVLHLDRVLTEKVQVRILDAEHHLLLSDAIREKGPFAKKYNLSNLPAGRYTVEIEDNYTIKYQPVEILDSSLVIDADHLTAIYKPFVVANGKLVDLTFLQLEDAKTEIEILDDAGFPVYNETIEDSGSITKRYDVSKLQAGNYVFQVAVKDRVYYRNFTVGGPTY